jgi:hypothetical protein
LWIEGTGPFDTAASMAGKRIAVVKGSYPEAWAREHVPTAIILPVDGTLAEMDELLAAIRSIIDGEEHAITVRHLFYRLVGLAVIPKTETAYHLLVRHLSRWRRDGEVSWDAFADSTRWHIRAATFDGISDALQRCKETYRRDMWSTQPHYVELWLEKDAIASIVAGVADQFGVPICYEPKKTYLVRGDEIGALPRAEK